MPCSRESAFSFFSNASNSLSPAVAGKTRVSEKMPIQRRFSPCGRHKPWTPVFANANEREARLDPALVQFNDALRQFALDLRGNGAAVNDVVTVWALEDDVWDGICGNHLDALDVDDGVSFQRASSPSSPVTIIRVLA